MVQFVGTYKFESEENFVAYLVSLGLSEEHATKFASRRENTVIDAVDKDSITAEYGGKSVKFPLNQEHEHVIAQGHTVWTTASVSGDVITFKTKLVEDGSVSEEKVLKVTDDGLIVTSTNSKGAKAVRKYKRV